jgi:tricorn protease
MGPVFDKRIGVYALALQPGNRFPFKPDDELSKPGDKAAEGEPEKAAAQAAEKAVAKAVAKTVPEPKAASKALPAIVYAGLRTACMKCRWRPGNYRALQIDDKRLYLLDAEDEGKGTLKTLAIASNARSRKPLSPTCATSTWLPTRSTSSTAPLPPGLRATC